MRRLVISSRASGDLGGIAQHTERTWGIAQKRRYLAIIEGALRRLRATPALGRPRDDLKAGYRSLVASVPPSTRPVERKVTDLGFALIARGTG